MQFPFIFLLSNQLRVIFRGAHEVGEEKISSFLFDKSILTSGKNSGCGKSAETRFRIHFDALKAYDWVILLLL